MNLRLWNAFSIWSRIATVTSVLAGLSLAKAQYGVSVVMTTRVMNSGTI